MSFGLAEIRAFVAVVRSGTFTQAANQMHITQPALSRRIQLIERTLGAPLFERLPVGPRLTETGQEFLPHAEAVLTALAEGLEAARSTVTGDRGRVSFAGTGALCTERLIGALRSFLDDAPETELSLSFHANTSNEVSDAVLQGEAMWGLRYRYDRRLHSELIGHEVLLFVCSPAHRLAERKNVGPAELEHETWVSYPLEAGHTDSAFWSNLAFFGIHGHRVILTDSTAAQKSLIQAEFGVGLMPRSTVMNDLREGRLTEIDVDVRKAVHPIVLVRRKGAYVSKVARRLEQKIAEAFQG